YPAQLEVLLTSESTQPRVEVLDFDVDGYNAYAEAMQFADLGRAYQPDLVMIQFCINDLNDPTLHFDRRTRLHLGRLPGAAFPNDSRPPGLIGRRRSGRGADDTGDLAPRRQPGERRREVQHDAAHRAFDPDRDLDEAVAQCRDLGRGARGARDLLAQGL